VEGKGSDGGVVGVLRGGRVGVRSLRGEAKGEDRARVHVACMLGGAA
jgi:hypothetical protein